MVPGARLELLTQRVEDFQRALDGFETMRARLIERRQNATDSAMLRIDDMLKLNARTLKSLHEALEAAKRDLHEERKSVQLKASPRRARNLGPADGV